MIMTTTGGNLADLNISVTSNIQLVQAQLRSLQAQLRGIASTGVTLNTAASSRQLSTATSAMNSASRSAAVLANSMSGIGSSMGNVNQTINRSSSSLMNLVAGLFLAERASKKFNISFFGAGEKFSAISNKMRTASASFLAPLDHDTNLREINKGMKSYVRTMMHGIDANILQRASLRAGISYSSLMSANIPKAFISSFKNMGSLSGKAFASAFKAVSKGAGYIALPPSAMPNISGMITNITSNAIKKAYYKAKAVKDVMNQHRNMIMRVPQIGIDPETAEDAYDTTSLKNNLARLEVVYARLLNRFMALRSMSAGIQAISGAVAGLIVKFVALGAVLAVVKTAIGVSIFKRVMEEGVRFNRVVENLTTSFKVLLGSQESFKDTGLLSPERLAGAKALTTQMQELAKYTPMLTTDLASAGETLMRFGVRSEDLMSTLKDIGEITGGDSERLSRMALALGQSVSMGRLTGQDRLQMVNAGFNPLKYIAEDMNVSMSEAEEAMSKGEISVEMLLKAINKAAKTDFAGYMSEQAKTLDGRMSTLRDTWQIFAGQVSKPIFDGLKSALEYVIKGFNVLSKDETLELIRKQVEQYVIPAFQELGKTLMWIFDLKGSLDMTDQASSTIKSVGAMITATSALAKVLYTITLLSSIAWNSFRMGIETTAVGITGLVELVVAVVKTILRSFQWLGGGIIGVFEHVVNSFASISDPAVDLYNTLAEKSFGAIEPIQKLRVEWQFDNKWRQDGIQGIKDAWDTSKKAFQFTQVGFEDILVGRAEQIMKDFKNLWNIGDLFGGKDQVNDLLKGLKKIKDATAPEYEPVDFSKYGTKGLEDAQEAAKKLAESMFSISQEIMAAMRNLVNFGNIFEKITYERFSPAKLVSRARRFFKEISNWTTNLASLEGKVSESVMQELREMGVAGFGITSALTRANPSQLAEVNALYKGSSLQALNQSVQQVQHTHMGTILVKGVNSLGELKGITEIIARDLARDKGLVSMDPAFGDLFK